MEFFTFVVMPPLNVLDQVAQTTIQLILYEPFYGHFLTGMVKEVNLQVSTLSLGINSNKTTRLAINPEHWEEILITPALRYGALKHEVLHLVFRHVVQGKTYANRQLFNLAADLVVNQYLAPDQLLQDAITLERFPELELPPFRSIAFYYDTLNDAWNKTLRRGLHISPALSQLMHPENGLWQGHELWPTEANILSAAEQTLLNGHIEDLLRNTLQRIGSKGMGKLPTVLQNQLKLQIRDAAPTLDWRRYLRLFFGTGQRTYLKNTLRKPSRRYGTNPGLCIRNKHQLLVAVDTSGSINVAELQAFFQEIHHIWQQGASIRIVECAAQINNTYLYRGANPQAINGGGETLFDPVIEFANRHSDADAVVYFTDGVAPPPKIHCRKPLLWVISKEGLAENSKEWNLLVGRKIKMLTTG